MPPPNVLLLYPRFYASSFWDNREASAAAGARMLSPPLGLITVAAMLPPHWPVRFIDRNCAEVAADDLAWADMVMTGGMLPQQGDTLEVVRLCRAHGVPAVVGGPDITSSPHLYHEADIQVLGEAELVIDDFVAAWESGARTGRFVAEKFQADVTRTPIPRFDLLTFADYLRIGVQFSRGCPFSCEFCDIIELYGRVPRVKTVDQMLAELDALYGLGYRGQVDFVDDNLVGNRKALREFLPRLVAWQREHGYPFEFSTEASVNIASDAAVLALMRDARFFALFVGIESPDEVTLAGTQKKQNTRRDLVESIHTIHAHGMWVTAGFILGFDDEHGQVGDAMVRFIEDSAIPICMV
ncbi:MAG: B12-binding domain-containing radical SAM protein, partial [Gemmatimonadota bacterium]|nr:B12-binding domain-containing radical SAM protein [Gemmatimonadota bacterium]